MSNERSSLSRRTLLTGASAAVGAAIAGTSGQISLAKAPILSTQAPYFYRLKVGSFEVTVVSDGPLALGDPTDLFPGTPKEEVRKILADNFLPREPTVEQNAVVVNTGERLILIDTGAGFLKMFGPHSGRLLASLKEAHFDPKDVDTVIMTHAHPDHCGGLMSSDGARHFPNAQFYLTQADYDFWTDEGKLGGPMAPFIEFARKNLVPNRDRLIAIKDEQEIVPGIQAISTPGHTVGHISLMINSGGKSLCNIGDLGHYHALAAERPRMEFVYDTDSKQAIASRVRMFDMLAANRIPLLAYHFPWPGIGHLIKQGDGYRYLPSPMQMTL